MQEKLNLEQIFNSLSSLNEVVDDAATRENIKLIGNRCMSQKGVYTVLTTLLYYKYLHPSQDIRRFQKRFSGGFSARSFDTKYVTPVLRKVGLPAMAESGWLTRSLEQPYPYDFDYKGAIQAVVKLPFLQVLDYIQSVPGSALACLVELLKVVKVVAEKSQVHIVPLRNPDRVTIQHIIEMLTEHFMTNYGTHGGAKLPVLAFHSIYSTIIQEVGRYKGCSLAELSSLTACDRTNKASGDIEIFRDDLLFEAVEIKLDRRIDAQIMRVVREKIYKWNPQRYYVLSVDGILESEEEEIQSVLNEVMLKHGCQIIINGLIPTIKYYLRLIENPAVFIRYYSDAVESDTELQPIHKKKWNDLLISLNEVVSNIS